jgi:hypothetical protein
MVHCRLLCRPCSSIPPKSRTVVLLLALSNGVRVETVSRSSAVTMHAEDPWTNHEKIHKRQARFVRSAHLGFLLERSAHTSRIYTYIDTFDKGRDRTIDATKSCGLWMYVCMNAFVCVCVLLLLVGVAVTVIVPWPWTWRFRSPRAL